LGRIAEGFDRFARGKLDEPIVPCSNDELGSLALEANRMAAALSKLSQERDTSDWIRAGQVELAEKLGRDLDPAQTAQIALEVLSDRVGAQSGALYLDDSDGSFARAAAFARSGSTEALSSQVARFRPGEGRLGRAAREASVSVVEGA